ncbi:MAG: hypothetical protein HXX18_09275 [Bacteroidetes bacterium]|nr:hypothetical protein [Bacteroidota bacterium]
MKKTSSEKSYISFSTPDPINSIVSVFKVFPDGSMETIGKINSYYLLEEGCVLYTASDLESQQIFPSSTDFTEIENQFIQYAKEQSEKSFIEAMKAEAEKSTNRKESLRHIRNLKFKDFEFNKSY